MVPAFRFRSAIVLALIALGVCSGESWAIPISITNFGFEDQQFADGGYTVGVITGWTLDGQQGPFNPNASEFFPVEAPEGQNTAFNNGGTISQVLSATLLADTTYTLLVDIGRRLDVDAFPAGGFPGYAVEFLAGGILLASESSLTPAKGTWLTSQINYFASAADPNLGQALEIRLVSNGIQTNFDDVRLDGTALAAVPEPSTWLLLGFGLAGLAAWRKNQESRAARRT